MRVIPLRKREDDISLCIDREEEEAEQWRRAYLLERYIWIVRYEIRSMR